MTENELFQKIAAGVAAQLNGGNGSIASELPAKISSDVFVDLRNVASPTNEQIAAVIDRHVRFALFYDGLAIDKASSPQTPSPER